MKNREECAIDSKLLTYVCLGNFVKKDGSTDVRATKKLLKKAFSGDFNIDEPITDGTTAIDLAVVSGNHKVAKILLELGASVEGLTCGMNVIHHAARKEDLEMMVILLSDNPNIVDIKGTGGLTALMYAALGQDIAAMNILVDYGADIHAKDDNGLSVAEYADMSNSHFNASWIMQKIMIDKINIKNKELDKVFKVGNRV